MASKDEQSPPLSAGDETSVMDKLRSDNELLRAANEDLSRRVADLVQSNADLNDQLRSTQLALESSVTAHSGQSDGRTAAERQRRMLAELQHRVRNILAVVRSLAGRTVETSGSLEDFASHFDGRLASLGRIHNVLARTEDATIEIGELVRDEFLAVGAREDENVDIDGPEIRLRQPVAQTLALALHELTTNALKYGALSQPQGRVALRWSILETTEGRRLSLDWRESGVPIVNIAPARRGFGRDLIERGLPYELGASTSLEFLPGGVRATIEMPIDETSAILEPERPQRSAE